MHCQWLVKTTQIVVGTIVLLLFTTTAPAFAAAQVQSKVTQPPNGTTTTARWVYDLPPLSPQTVMNPVIATDAQSAIALVPTNTTVYAFDLLSGALHWSTTFLLPNDDSVGYVSMCQGLVFVGCVHQVVALNATNGNPVWEVALVPSTAPAYNPMRHARVDCFSDPSRLFVASFNAPLLLLDPMTGSVLRNFSDVFVNSYAKDHVHVTGTHVLFLNVFVGMGSGSAASSVSVVVALDKVTLDISYMISGAVNMLVDAVGHRLFVRYSVGTNQTVAVYNTTDGSALWAQSEPGLYATFDYFFADGTLYMATSMVNDAYPNNLTAYDASSGAVLWRRVIGFFYLLAGSDAVFALGTVTVAKAYHGSTGALLWSYDAVAVNDGAVGKNTVVFGTATQIIALVANPTSLPFSA